MNGLQNSNDILKLFLSCLCTSLDEIFHPKLLLHEIFFLLVDANEVLKIFSGKYFHTLKKDEGESDLRTSKGHHPAYTSFIKLYKKVLKENLKVMKSWILPFYFVPLGTFHCSKLSTLTLYDFAENSQLTFTSSKSAIDTLEKDVTCVNNKNTRMTSVTRTTLAGLLLRLLSMFESEILKYILTQKRKKVLEK